MRKEILQAEKFFRASGNKLIEILKKIQKECSHKKVHEAPYEPDNWFCYHKPPFRVCVDCGYAEEGWGCGFQLTAKSKVIKEGTRDEVDKLRRGPLRKNTAAFDYKIGRLTGEKFFCFYY